MELGVIPPYDPFWSLLGRLALGLIFIVLWLAFYYILGEEVEEDAGDVEEITLTGVSRIK